MICEMKLHPAPYEAIREGVKTVEIRLFDEKRSALSAGDLILFKKLPYLHEMLYKQVGKITRYSSCDEIFSSYEPALLGCKEDDTAESFRNSIGKIYSPEKIEKYGLCAIDLLPFDSSSLPYEVTKARRINQRDIEIYFDRDFETGTDPKPEEFELTLDGQPLSIEKRYGFGHGKTHFCRMTTLRLTSPLPTGDDAPTVKVTLGGKEYDAPFEDYYKYRMVSKSGVPVNGSATLLWGMKTVERAAEMVDIQLSQRPDIAAQMVNSGASLAIFGKGECAYHIPEHRESYQVGSLYVEGFGGTTCSITECNVWHWHNENSDRPDPEYTTHYKNENIMIHEFGHGVKIAGFDRMEDRSTAEEFQMVYRHAKAAGLWPNSYAISNSDEYFATLSAIWFNVMNECSRDDGWDGTRGPINTRRELYNYDIDAYKFFSKIYPHVNLDGAWSPVPDYVHVTGLKDEPDVDFTGKNYMFNYPERANMPLVIAPQKKYKITDPRGGLVIDIGACDGHVGVWYDYSGVDVNMDNMTFELEPAGENWTYSKKREDGEEMKAHEVYIRANGGGYLSAAGDRIDVLEGKEQGTIFTFELFDEKGFCAVKADGKRLVCDGKPDMGVPLTLTGDENKRGGVWRLYDLEDMKKHALFIHDGETDGESHGVVAAEGQTVRLTAPMTNESGERFSKWEASHGTVADASANETTIVMPESDTVVWARYEKTEK